MLYKAHLIFEINKRFDQLPKFPEPLTDTLRNAIPESRAHIFDDHIFLEKIINNMVHLEIHLPQKERKMETCWRKHQLGLAWMCLSLNVNGGSIKTRSLLNQPIPLFHSLFKLQPSVVGVGELVVEHGRVKHNLLLLQLAVQFVLKLFCMDEKHFCKLFDL